jgi:hypothetical protein
MSNRQNRNRDPVKRAAKRARQREALATSTASTRPGQDVSRSQATHASSGRARKKARDGERAMDAERQQLQEEEDDR